MIKHKITGWIIVLVMAYPVLCIGGQDESIGKVVALRGAVVAVAEDGQKRDLGMNAQVFARDVIETGIGRVQLMFKDNTLITLGRNTKMALATYAWDPENKKAEMETQIREGSFRIMGGAITRMAPEKFKTTSVSGTIGIRGSMYAGNLRGTRLTVMFHGGKGIYVQNRAGMVNINRPGFATLVENADKAPAPPAIMSPSDLMELETLLLSDQAGQEEQTEDGVLETENSQPHEAAGELVSDSDARQNDPDDSALSVAGADTPNTSSVVDTDTTSAVSDATKESVWVTLEEDAESLADEDADTSVEEVSDTFVEEEPDTTAEEGSDTSAEDDPDVPVEDVPDVQEEEPEPDIPEEDTTETSTEDGTQPPTENQNILDHLKSLGFTGSQSTSVPATGLWKYSGNLKSTLGQEDTQDITCVVNWDNGRIIIFEEFNAGSSNQSVGFSFGNISASGEISGMVVLGSELSVDGPVLALDGTETFGAFYGASQEALGLAMEGFDVNIQDQTQTFAWADTLAATLSGTTSDTFSGIESWSGFFTGVGENMNNPNIGRHVFLNHDKSDFAFTIDKDGGVFSGTMSGDDVDGVMDIYNVVIGGGTSNSAYLSDNVLAATLTGTDVIYSASNTASLKSHGNYMVSSKENPLSSHTTWGYWEAAYTDPDTPNDYHIHVPGSFWIAGVPTDVTVVQGLIDTVPHPTATYIGKAVGVKFSNTMSLTELTNGNTSLYIDFGSQTVSGSIDFTEVSLVLKNGQVTSSGFSGEIDTATQSQVSGAFYGSNAEGVGGNFSATFSDAQYLGIFAGDK